MAFEKLSPGQHLERYQNLAPNQYVQTKEQLLALQVAYKLDDRAHLAWYMRLCKTVDEKIINQALSFVVDSQSTTKGRLFMWKVRELRRELLAQGKITPAKLGPRPVKKAAARRPTGLFD
jgi:hypothetical protein